MAAELQDTALPETPPEAEPQAPRYQRFARELVARGKLRETEIIRAQRLATQTDESRIPALLVKLGVVSERDTAEILADVSGCPLVTPDDYPDTSPLPETISVRFLKENHMVGLAANDDQVVVAVTDPFDQELLDAIALACDRPVSARVGLGTEIDRALETQRTALLTAMADAVSECRTATDQAAELTETGEIGLLRLVEILCAAKVQRGQAGGAVLEGTEVQILADVVAQLYACLTECRFVGPLGLAAYAELSSMAASLMLGEWFD